MSRIYTLAAFLSILSWATAHTVITYPGWRGDNLLSNGTIGVDDYKDHTFPYGMQWIYPCGGLDQGPNPNRTYWGINGGAVALQPGWFQGHSIASLHINLGIGNVPKNYSLIMQPTFAINGPTNDAYKGLNICLPQVPLPANLTVQEGDNATIQVIENAKHGAALFSCVDITFTSNHSLIKPINEENCYNDSQITFGQVFSTAALAGDASSSMRQPGAKAFAAMSAGLLGAAAWTLL